MKTNYLQRLSKIRDILELFSRGQRFYLHGFLLFALFIFFSLPTVLAITAYIGGATAVLAHPKIRQAIRPLSARRKQQIFTAIIVGFGLPILFANKIGAGLFALCTISVFALGICIEIYDVIAKLWSSPLGKYFVSSCAALGSTCALALSHQVIADVTSVSPAQFPYATTLIGILFIPVFIGLGVLGLYLVTVILYPFAIPIYLVLEKKTTLPFRFLWRIRRSRGTWKTHLTVLLGRLLAVACLLSLVHLGADHVRDYDHFLASSTRSVIFSLEMHRGTTCDPIEDNQRLVYLSDTQLLIGTKTAGGDVTFETRACHAKNSIPDAGDHHG